jgi:hypothetical protein
VDDATMRHPARAVRHGEAVPPLGGDPGLLRQAQGDPQRQQ